MDSVEFLFPALNTLCPMHLVVTKLGRIANAGGTAQKLFAQEVVGKDLWQIIDITKPKLVMSKNVDDLVGRSLSLTAKNKPSLQLKGHCAQIGTYFILNLSFGLSVASAVKQLDLTSADFAPTDPSVGMLYLAEAKTMALEEYRNLSARLEGAKRIAENDANTDPLTGLLNRRGFEEAVNALVNSHEPFAVLQLDLDYFKAVNDGLGHAAGDELLKRVADILRQETRKEDLICRNGGDEFTIVLSNVPHLSIATGVGGLVAQIGG